MAWMRMPGQTWSGAAAAFLGMWAPMMVAMMLPSVAPVLWRYRQAAAGAGPMRAGVNTILAGAGYFFVWTASGLVVFPVGAALAAVVMARPSLARAVPPAAGVAVAIAGAWQLTEWKARQLCCARLAIGRDRALPWSASAAWRCGVSLGFACCRSCANLMAILLVVGVMDVRAMVAVGAAITAERLAPAGERVARVIGAVGVAAGMVLIGRAAGVG